VAVLLALVSAVTYGSADFMAGLLSRRGGVVLVALLLQSSSAVVGWIALIFMHAPTPDLGTVIWGVVAGAGNFVGTMLLFRGLSRGLMTVISPVSAVATAVGSAAVGLILGDRPGVLALIGVVCACLAIWLVSATAAPASRETTMRSQRQGLLDGLGAGVGFTLLLVGLNRAGSSSGLWPVVVSQTTVVLLLLPIALVMRAKIRLARRVVIGGLAAGLFGAAAVITYFYATHMGLLTITAVIASLYPATTVALAVTLLRERVRAVQAVGLALAAAAVALLAAQ
jgi:drug/metabolite transporter (DMT)-like permease